jgi:hypothetical protein
MNRSVRILLLILLGFTLVWAGFQRERKLLVITNGLPGFINRYPKPPTGNYGMQLKGLLQFNPSPKMQSSILFGITFTLLAAGIIYLLTLNRKLTILTALLYLLLLFLCFILLQLGTTGMDYRLSIGLAHSIEDIVLSPFLLMVLIVLLKLNNSIRLEKGS